MYGASMGEPSSRAADVHGLLQFIGALFYLFSKIFWTLINRQEEAIRGPARTVVLGLISAVFLTYVSWPGFFLMGYVRLLQETELLVFSSGIRMAYESLPEFSRPENASSRRYRERTITP